MHKGTEEKYKEVCRLFGEGKTREQIAEATFYSRPTIDRILQRYGDIPTRDSFKDHKEEALFFWDQGMTIKGIAEKTGLSVNTIQRNLKKLKKCRGRGRRRQTDIPEEEMRERGKAREGSAGRAGRRPKEEVPGPVPVQYAEHVRKSKKVVIRGKAYQDVTAWYT